MILPPCLILQEIQTNLRGGIKHISLVTEDFLLYGSKDVEVNSKAILDLIIGIQRLQKQYHVANINISNVSFASVKKGKKTVEQICQEMGTNGWTYSSQLGLYLQNQGLVTDLVTSNPDIVRPDLDINSQEEILEEIVRRRDEAEREAKEQSKPESEEEGDRVKSYQSIQDYMKAGGRIVIAIPNSKVIENLIRSGNLCIVNLTDRWKENREGLK